jgi:phospho-N-acetylmuramoyl-pentapeptide-transferase
MLTTAAVGAIDDRVSVVASGGGGLSAGVKFVVLGRIGLLAAVLLWAPNGLGVDEVFVPGSRLPHHLGVAIVPLPVLAIADTAHAVNLTDGLDGLAGHTSAVAFASYGVIAYLPGQIYLGTFCFTTPALLAFLWFNAYPTQVMTGDTGALALAATLAVVALMLGQVLLLPLVGFVFVAITVSVMLRRTPDVVRRPGTGPAARRASPSARSAAPRSRSRRCAQSPWRLPPHARTGGGSVAHFLGTDVPRRARR